MLGSIDQQNNFLLGFCLSSSLIQHKRMPLNDNLWLAAAAGDIELTNVFLCQGAQVNIEHSQMGTTPLMIAALHGHSEVCKLLCLYGSDVDGAEDDGGQTALNACAMAGCHGGWGESLKATLQTHADEKFPPMSMGGLSGGSSVRRPGSEDPHRLEWKFLYYLLRTFQLSSI